MTVPARFTRNPGFTAWLQLFRLPNLLTVPGDVLAGFILASGGPASGCATLALAVAVSLCLYASGLLLNDLVDYAEDQRERPGRPLPAGTISVRAVRVVAMKLFALALLLSFFAGPRTVVVAMALGGAVLLYNFKTKRSVGWGAVNMGVCRGLNVLLGAASAGVGFDSAVAGAAIIALYVAALTHVARYETEMRDKGSAPWLPFGAGLVGLAGLAGMAQPGSAQAWTGFIGSALLALVPALTFARKPALRGPSGIGAMVGALLLFQAALCMAFGAITIGLVLLLLWPLFRVLARTYSSS